MADALGTARAFDAILDDRGRIDILVNNAGVTRDTLVLRMKEEDWQQVLQVNLSGMYHCSKAAIRPMIRQRYGRIINITSIVGIIGNAGQVNYAAAKAGAIGLTKALAREVASRGITVNAVAPGFIETEMTQGLSAQAKADLVRQILLADGECPRMWPIASAFWSRHVRAISLAKSSRSTVGCRCKGGTFAVASIEQRVKDIIVEQLGVEEDEVSPEASFIDDLGADSLDTVELVMAFEEEFNIEIPDEDAEGISTVQDAIDYIKANVKEV